MQFGLTEEQQELASTVRSLLGKRADSTAVRAAMASPDGYDRDLWTTLCEQIGAAALAIPEEYGGAGFTLFETGIVLEELGRSLAPAPLLAGVLSAEALLASGDKDACSRLLPRIAAGEIAAVAGDAGDAGDVLRDGRSDSHFVGRPAARRDGDAWVIDGQVDRVLHGDQAAVLLVVAEAADGPALFEVDPAAGVSEWTPAMDPTLRLARLTFDGTPATLLTENSDAVLRRTHDARLAAIACLQVGVAQRGLDMTVAYSKERVQFGRQIGSFQALKHRMADMLVSVETARSAAWAAMYAVATDAADTETLAAMAASYCTEALDHVAAETVQLHGGIAITWEHDAQLVFKRAHALRQLAGPPHRNRAALVR